MCLLNTSVSPRGLSNIYLYTEQNAVIFCFNMLTAATQQINSRPKFGSAEVWDLNEKLKGHPKRLCDFLSVS
jgi:hypothetical protein